MPRPINAEDFNARDSLDACVLENWSKRVGLMQNACGLIGLMMEYH